MPKRKRPKSPGSDSGSSYKHESTDEDEPIPQTPVKRTRTFLSHNSASPAKLPSQNPPGTLLTALNNLAKAEVISPSPSGRSRAVRSATTSPRKAVSPKKSKLVVKPEKEWRNSDIPIDRMITKGFAQKLFRLTANDINESQLAFQKRNRVGGAQGFMLLYNMREIENLAWRKHGGPEGFDQKLVHDKERWIAKGKDVTAFPMVPQPFNRFTDNKCVQCNTVFIMPSSVWYNKCDPCRGIQRRTYTQMDYGYHDLFDGLDDADEVVPSYGGSCLMCDILGICCDD